MREHTPIEAAVTELSPEEAVTNGWLDRTAVYLILPTDDGEPERLESA